MTTLNINGQHVNVDDSFLALSPDQQQTTVDHIAASLAPPAPDIGDGRASTVAALRGIPIAGAYVDKGAAALNAAAQPFTETGLSNAPSFSERMAENEKTIGAGTNEFERTHPIGTTVGKMAIGAASMAPLIAAAPELLGASGTMAARMGYGAVSNATIGGADSAARGHGVAGGAIVGGLLGAGAPVAESLASSFISRIQAMTNPAAYAERQVARAASESGRPIGDITGDVTRAAAEGQPQFTVADAMGLPGQRMLSTVARDTGEGRTAVADALNSRQSSQGGRIVDSLEQGFGSRMTPAALEDAMTASRGANADAEYGAVRNDAGPVNVTPVLDHIDSILGPAADQMLAHPGSVTPNDTVESVLQGFRGRISRVNPDDFQSAQRIRGDLADTIGAAVRSGANNKARLLGGVQRQLDAALEDASSGFKQANANFSQATRDIGAIDQGSQAFSRGRTGDILGDFNSLQPRGQQAFRAGFVDPAIAKVTGAADGVNKARFFLNDRFREMADATAPGNELMQRQLAREQVMSETRGQALGGSGTSHNLNEDAAMAINPTIVGHVVSQNWGAAIGSMLHAGSNAITGNTPAVRAAVAKILLQNGATLNPAQINAMVTKTIGQIQFLQQLARSGAGAAATTTNASQRPTKAPIFVR
jgi:hypothetical protein